MTTSEFCIEQRQQEKQNIKKLLLFGFASSSLLHGIVFWTIPQWSVKSPQKLEPIELIMVEQPKSKPKPQPVIKPKPKPVKAKVSPPPQPSPKPTQAKTPPPPQPIPKKVLTSSTTSSSQPIVATPTERPASNHTITNSNNSTVANPNNNSKNPNAPSTVAVGTSAPPAPKPKTSRGISCIVNCQPQYPAALSGAEGSAGVKLTINSSGNVIGVELTTANGNSQVNRQALLAARKMQFSSPPNGSASVQVKINFTVAGSEYDRQAREEQKKREQEAARQRQLERERQARQEQLERERQAQQEQLERERQAQPTDYQPAPKPLTAPLETNVDDEMLRKFRERIEQHQQN